MRTTGQQNLLRLQQRLRIANGNSEVGAAKAPDYGEGHANHLAVAVDERAARAAGGGLGVVDNFIGQDVADMSLRYQGADQLALLEFVHNFFWVPAAQPDNVLYGVFSRARQNGAYSSRVAQ